MIIKKILKTQRGNQHNGQEKKRTNNDLQNIHIKLNIEKKKHVIKKEMRTLSIRRLTYTQLITRSYTSPIIVQRLLGQLY
jgi:hypothetical protein